ncbi:DUF7845 domain-containing protein [Natronococcus roseus]|uniref:DUF7845 domain-containing protein n=1 Tax=Natronococcus roseus TaxID=1052014 RepID=UPI00374CE3F3
MSINTTTEHKNTDVSPVNDSPEANNRAETYPVTPMVHAATVFIQLEDDNALYDWLSAKQREFDTLRDEPGTSANPHLVAHEYTPVWDRKERECEIGLFTSATGYGKRTSDGEFIPETDYHLGLYADALEAKKPPLPAKCKLVVDKREAGLQSCNGGEFSWPPGTDGRRWEGTHLKIQTSYITNPLEAVTRAEEMLSAAFDDFNSLDEFGDLIPEMCRVRGVEVYIRFHRDLAEATVRELEQSANLTVKADGEGDIYSQFRNGECTNYGFKTTRLPFLGLDTNSLEDPPNSVKLKAYAATRHNQRADGDPLRHWKLEATINGAYAWDDWAAVRHYAERIVCSHALWAGIREDDLIPDEWFLAGEQSQEPLSFDHPADRRNQLTEFWQSQRFERTVLGRLFNSRTKSYYDCLCVLLNRANDQITYQEMADEIGLTTDTIGRIAGKLEEDGIVVRGFSGIGYIRWQSQQAKDTVHSLLDRDITEAERREKIEARADERRRDREAQRERDSDSEVTDREDADPWVEVPESGIDAEELAERLLNGDIDPADVSLRPGG